MHEKIAGQEYFARTGLPLSVFPIAPRDTVPFHSHDFAELVVVVSGTGWHLTGEHRYPITTGDVFVIRGDVEHAYQECDRLELYNVLFDLPRLHLPMQDLYQLPAFHALFALEPGARGGQDGFHHHLQLSAEDLTDIARLLAQMHGELTTQQAGYRGVCVGLFMQAIAFLARRYATITGPEPQKLLRLGTALSVIEGRLAEPMTLEILAQAVGVSASTLQRAFRRAFGRSPIEYVQQRRLALAEELLRYTEISITEVASRVGITDSNYFARQFHWHYGCSPRAYRKKRSST